MTILTCLVIFSTILSIEARAEQTRIYSDRQMFAGQKNSGNNLDGEEPAYISRYAMNGGQQGSGEARVHTIFPGIRRTIDPGRQEALDQPIQADDRGSDEGQDNSLIPLSSAIDQQGQLSDIDNEGFVEAEQSGFTAGERPEPETSDLQPRDSDLRWGIFAVQPELILRSTFSDNIHQDHSKKPDFSTGLEGRIQATTDTSRHELAIDVAFLKTAFHSSNKKETMDYSACVDGRLDITSRQAIEGGLALTRENGSGSRIRREDTLETAAHIGLRQRFNRLTISLRGEVLDLEDQNSSSKDYREIGGRLTGNYELRSGYALGIETNFHRRNDKIVPGSGGNRSRAKFTSILAGIDIVNEKPVQGSFRAGYGWSEDTDPSAGKLEGIVVEGNLTWRPTRLTMLQLAGSTEISGTSDPSNGTSMDYLLTLNLDHALTRHFLLSAKVESEFNRYRDTGNMDRTLTYTLAGEYELNRRLAIVGTASHKTFNSIDGLGDYRENQLSLAMRVKQ